jgi:predicted permease
VPVFATIIPIFTVIALGWVAHRRGYIPDSFIEPANRLVYNLAIPAMIFRAITRTPIDLKLYLPGVTATVSAVAAIFGLAWVMGRILKVSQKSLGSFIQCAMHGNLGYIGLAVVYYHLGDPGVTVASIYAGFIMITQNILAVIALQVAANQSPGARSILKIVTNPVIVAATVGMIWSAQGSGLPLVLDRTLTILADMALPLALLIIGSSLNISAIRRQLRAVAVTSLFKLGALPLLGLLFLRLTNLAPAAVLPAMILLAAPTATVSYVMAGALGGDTDLATAAISVSTIGSAATYLLWLSWL